MILLGYAFLTAVAAYQVLAIAACLKHLLRREPRAVEFPAVSILKPVRGADPAFYDAIRSHAAQDYPEFEILFGCSDPGDPAIGQIRRLQAEFPQLPIRLIETRTVAPNRKVGVLMDLGAAARHPLRVVNDGDIRVPDGYLRNVVSPLMDPRVGLVTCLYRARADSFPARWEAVGIATDFAPSAMVAPLVGVNEFGLGSTLAFRAADFEATGGFAGIADYIADDYQLGKRISVSGKKVLLSSVVVETHLHGESWGDVWRHQVRWARTIRLSRGGGYLGIPLTNASLWALVAACCGWWWWAVALLALRFTTAAISAGAVLGDREAMKRLWLVPFRDLWGFAVWGAGLGGSRVEWGGEELGLDSEGRIVR